MRSRGWSIDVDQIFGPGSERVCRQFQQEKRLTVDGKVGPQTWAMTWSAPVT
jgi:peptidoglycan hydrolase-like protein with peptidoglycan-binding domain